MLIKRPSPVGTIVRSALTVALAIGFTFLGTSLVGSSSAELTIHSVASVTSDQTYSPEPSILASQEIISGLRNIAYRFHPHAHATGSGEYELRLTRPKDGPGV